MQKWYNTDVTRVAEMLDVSDEYFESICSDTVDRVNIDDLRWTQDDPDIFGKLGEPNNDRHDAMGIIRFPVPILNIQYFQGCYPILARLLDMSFENVEKLAYYETFIVTACGNSDFEFCQMITRKERDEARNAGCCFQTLTGAEAIGWLLELRNIPNRERMVLTSLPVLPLELRYASSKDNEEAIYTPNDLYYLYFSVILRTSRINNLLDMKDIPETVLWDSFCALQESVDALVNNGVRTCKTTRGIALESLNELAEQTSKHRIKICYAKPRTHISTLKPDFYKAVFKLASLYNEEFEGTDTEDTPAVAAQKAVVASMLRPYFNEYMLTYYNRYISLADHIFSAVSAPIIEHLYTNGASEKNESMQRDAEAAITRNTDFYIHKRLKWRQKPDPKGNVAERACLIKGADGHTAVVDANNPSMGIKKHLLEGNSRNAHEVLSGNVYEKKRESGVKEKGEIK